MNAFCFLSAIPMRSEASHCSEMVNQLLFGDSVELLDSVPEWLKVKSLYDGYTGWVSDKQLRLMEHLPATDFVVPCNTRAEYDGIDVTLPAGSSCSRSWLIDATPASDTELRPTSVAMQFLGTPYLWGGRTSMGIDCSGLVQVVYKICGFKMPRDASQQASIGTETSIVESKPGDLAFFSNGNGKIVHVGIVDSDNMIIHASGRVRRDPLDATGIFNNEINGYSHRLAFIKRL